MAPPVGEPLKPGETAAMKVTVEEIIMTRHDPARRQRANFFGARLKQLRRAVQNRGWPVNIEEVACEHVAAEQQVVSFTEKSAVAERVTGQMQHAQSTPE